MYRKASKVYLDEIYLCETVQKWNNSGLNDPLEDLGHD